GNNLQAGEIWFGCKLLSAAEHLLGSIWLVNLNGSIERIDLPDVRHGAGEVRADFLGDHFRRIVRRADLDDERGRLVNERCGPRRACGLFGCEVDDVCADEDIGITLEADSRVANINSTSRSRLR